MIVNLANKLFMLHKSTDGSKIMILMIGSTASFRAVVLEEF